MLLMTTLHTCPVVDAYLQDFKKRFRSQNTFAWLKYSILRPQMCLIRYVIVHGSASPTSGETNVSFRETRRKPAAALTTLVDSGFVGSHKLFDSENCTTETHSRARQSSLHGIQNSPFAEEAFRGNLTRLCEHLSKVDAQRGHH